MQSRAVRQITALTICYASQPPASPSVTTYSVQSLCRFTSLSQPHQLKIDCQRDDKKSCRIQRCLRLIDTIEMIRPHGPKPWARQNLSLCLFESCSHKKSHIDKNRVYTSLTHSFFRRRSIGDAVWNTHKRPPKVQVSMITKQTTRQQ